MISDSVKKEWLEKLYADENWEYGDWYNDDSGYGLTYGGAEKWFNEFVEFINKGEK